MSPASYVETAHATTVTAANHYICIHASKYRNNIDPTMEQHLPVTQHRRSHQIVFFRTIHDISMVLPATMRFNFHSDAPLTEHMGPNRWRAYKLYKRRSGVSKSHPKIKEYYAYIYELGTLLAAVHRFRWTLTGHGMIGVEDRSVHIRRQLRASLATLTVL